MTQAAPDRPPAWTGSDLKADVHSRDDKASRVQRMFGAIAGKYDMNNRVHSLGRDQAWRRFAVKMARLTPSDDVLDVACGTGDLSQQFARAGARRVVGLDFTPEMLDVARQKKRKHAAHEKIEYVQGDAQDLPFEDASFDVLSIAFGIRNVQEPVRALREFARVLRPGGRLVILEFDQPRFAPVRWFNGLYCRRIMPVTATLLSGDRSGAYRYLPQSVATWMTRDEMTGALTEIGFSDVQSKSLSCGICVCFSATR